MVKSAYIVGRIIPISKAHESLHDFNSLPPIYKCLCGKIEGKFVAALVQVWGEEFAADHDKSSEEKRTRGANEIDGMQDRVEQVDIWIKTNKYEVENIFSLLPAKNVDRNRVR